MAKKLTKPIYQGFTGEPCSQCGWGPSAAKTLRITDHWGYTFSHICLDCISVFNAIVRQAVKMHGENIFVPLTKWLVWEGFDLPLVDD